MDFVTEVKRSKNVMVSKPRSKKPIKLVASEAFTFEKAPNKPMSAQYKPKIGTVIVEAKTRVTTKYLNGLIADTSIASICSVTRMEPNSAPMLDPTLPAQINAVTKEARARTMAIEIKEGSQEVAPKVSSEGRDCFVNTMPVINPVKVIKGKDFRPIS